MLLIPDTITAYGERTAPQFAHAFAAGCGGIVFDDYNGGPWAGFGSPQTWEGLQDARRARQAFYYGDHAYFARGIYYRITKNAYQHSGVGDSDGRRLDVLGIAPKKWKKNGSSIIVCPQSDAYHARMGQPNWLEETLAKLAANSDRPIKVRRKRGAHRTLAQDLENAWCVVVHTSNAAVEAVLAGVPAICTGDCAGSRMSLTDPGSVEYPIYPSGRLRWAGVLADNQWTLAEIASGMAWKQLEGIKC